PGLGGRVEYDPHAGGGGQRRHDADRRAVAERVGGEAGQVSALGLELGCDRDVGGSELRRFGDRLTGLEQAGEVNLDHVAHLALDFLAGGDGGDATGKVGGVGGEAGLFT